MKGTLYLLTSRNPPVFSTPMNIFYEVAPKKGQAFLFTRGGFSRCNTSTVRKVTKFDGFLVIQTLNSAYSLQLWEEK